MIPDSGKNKARASLGRIRAMAEKEFLHIIRDMRTLYIALGMPVLMILLFGYAVDFDIDHIKIGICDQDNSSQSRDLIQKLQAGHWFEAQFITRNQTDLESALDAGTIKIGLVLPAGLARRMARGESVTVGAIVDGSDNNAAVVGMNYLELFFATYNGRIIQRFMENNGAVMHRLEVRPRILFNPDLKTRFYIIPGIIVLILAVLAALLTSLAVAREWERGSMEQLISTPVRSHEIILGKILPYMGISLFQTILVTLFAVFLFKIPFEGSLLSLLFTSLLFASGALGLGLLFSSVLKSQLPAMQVALVATMLPSLFLSNFVFPIASMPPLVRLITYIVPAKYFLVMLRTIFLKGSGIMGYWSEILFLCIFTFLVLTVATKRMVKRMDT
ncbi:MAG: ABC transporter permease [Leptospiraceae bacterium]|nr:ABC transporter permease [Leptospiraceae bacterium]